MDSLLEGAKRCTKCGETKPFTEFWKDKRGKNGLSARCKSCKGTQNRAYAANNRDKLKEYHRVYMSSRQPKPKEMWNAAPSPKIHRCRRCGIDKPRTPEFWPLSNQAKDGLAYQCIECRRVINREYARARRVAKALGGIIEKPEPLGRPVPLTAKVEQKRCADCQTVKPANQFPGASKGDGLHAYCLVCHSKRTQAWRKENPTKAQAQWRRNRARRVGAEGRHTWEDVASKYQAQDGRCWWCNCKVGDSYAVDHVIPVSRGGSDNPENIVITCPNCNRRKHAKLPHKFIGRLF
jgi:5-methylcytosine-specific restriction endonuclease McrA